MKDMNLFETVKKYVCQCSLEMQLTPNIEAILKMPLREYHVSIPVRMDDGSIQVFQGFRVQYNDARGPTKGGIRFHQDETIDTIRGLAALMTWKCALHRLPLGGAKGGVICNPKMMSEGELERLSRAYIQVISHVIGPDRDIPAPDMYTNSQTMAWMMDEYSRLMGKTTLGVVTGKPVTLGGSQGREDATARGGWFVLEEAARDGRISLKGARVAIQGFGNVGLHAALIGQREYGCTIVAVSDSRGGVYNEKGIDIEGLATHKRENGTVIGFRDGNPIENRDLLQLPVDLLIPAALENVITLENVDRIQASLIAEFANGPTTPDADDVFFTRGTTVLPDFLCNGGGLIVSYFEMIQNLNMDRWDEEEVHRRLRLMMVEAYREVAMTARNHQISLRRAAYTLAVQHVVEAMKVRGWV